MQINLLLVLFMFIIGCSSDIEDLDRPENTAFDVDSIGLVGTNSITEKNSNSSNIIRKEYLVQVCLKNTRIQGGMENLEVIVDGISRTTNTSGCLSWEEKINFDYSGDKRCQKLSKTITIKNSRHSIEAAYSIDTLNDILYNLNDSDVCQSIDDRQDKISKQKFNSNKGVSSQDVLIELDTMKISYNRHTITQEIIRKNKIDGLQTNRRSDVEFLAYKGTINSKLKAIINNVPIKNADLEIKVTDLELKSNLNNITLTGISTNSNGEFTFSLDQIYRQYEFQHFTKKELVVKIVSGPLKDQEIKRIFYINPWQIKSFGMDSKLGTPPNLNKEYEKSGDTNYENYQKVHVDNVMYVQVGNNINKFNIDNDLNLVVSKTFQVVLDPKINTGITQSNVTYPSMADGQFRLQFMLMAPKGPEIEINETNFENFDYITGIDKIVKVQNGKINTIVDLPIKYSSLPRLATRAVSVFKLTSVDNIGIRETIVTGFFRANMTWIKTNVLQSDVLEKNTPSDDVSNAGNKSNLQKNKVLEINQNEKRFKISIENHLKRINNKTMSLYKNSNKSPQNFDKSVETFKKNKLKMYIDEKTYLNKDFKFLPTINDTDLLAEKNAEMSLDIPNNSIRLTNEDIHYLYSNPSNLSDKEIAPIFERLCDLYYPKKNIKLIPDWVESKIYRKHARCKKNPSDYFKINRSLHTKKINALTPVRGNMFTVTLSSDFSSAYNESLRENITSRQGVDLGAKIPLGSNFGIGVRLLDITNNVSEDRGKSESSADRISSRKSINVESFVFKLKGNFDKCITIESLNPIIKRSDEEINKLEHMYCVFNQEVDVNESWFLILDQPKYNGLLVDTYNPMEIVFAKVVRGEENFNYFINLLKDETKKYAIDNTFTSDSPENKLYERFGHLLNIQEGPSIDNAKLLNNLESNLPGIIVLKSHQPIKKRNIGKRILEDSFMGDSTIIKKIIQSE